MQQREVKPSETDIKTVEPIKASHLVQEAHQVVGQVKRRALKIRPKSVANGIFGRFRNFDKCRSEVAYDIISGAAVGYFDLDVRATFGASGLNSGRINLLFGWPDPFAKLLSII